MERVDKEKAVAELHEKLARVEVGIVTQMKGIDVETVTKLRKQRASTPSSQGHQEQSAIRAAQGLPPRPREAFQRADGIAWSYEDPSAGAKVVKAFRKEARGSKLQIKAGLIDGSVSNPQAVEEQLATMPGKDELGPACSRRSRRPSSSSSLSSRRPRRTSSTSWRRRREHIVPHEVLIGGSSRQYTRTHRALRGRAQRVHGE